MSKTRFSHASAFGLAASMAVIALALIIYLAGLKNSALNWLSYPIGITIACIGVKKWREQNGGYLTFGQTYMHLFLQSLVYAIIITIWSVVFMVYIAPGMIEDQMLIQQAQMEDEGKMSQEQIEMAMHYARMFTSPALIAVFAFFGNLIAMAVINLIIAAIMKKDPPPAQFMPPGYTELVNAPPQGGQQYPNNPYQQNNPPQQ